MMDRQLQMKIVDQTLRIEQSSGDIAKSLNVEGIVSMALSDDARIIVVELNNIIQMLSLTNSLLVGLIKKESE